MIAIHASFNQNLLASFDFSGGTCDLSSSGPQFHISTAFLPDVTYRCLTSSFQNILDAQAGLNASIGYSHSTGLFEIDFGETVEWSCGPTTTFILGFPSMFTGSVISSSYRPNYILLCREANRSEYSYDYEPNILEKVSYTDTGYPVTLPRLTASIFQDWVHFNEPKSAVFSSDALTGSVPWTWQHFFSHCRSARPFAVYIDGARASYNRLRADKSMFRPRAMFSGYDGEYKISLATQCVKE